MKGTRHNSRIARARSLGEWLSVDSAIPYDTATLTGSVPKNSSMRSARSAAFSRPAISKDQGTIFCPPLSLLDGLSLSIHSGRAVTSATVLVEVVVVVIVAAVSLFLSEPSLSSNLLLLSHILEEFVSTLEDEAHPRERRSRPAFRFFVYEEKRSPSGSYDSR